MPNTVICRGYLALPLTGWMGNWRTTSCNEIEVRSFDLTHPATRVMWQCWCPFCVLLLRDGIGSFVCFFTVSILGHSTPHETEDVLIWTPYYCLFILFFWGKLFTADTSDDKWFVFCMTCFMWLFSEPGIVQLCQIRFTINVDAVVSPPL